MEKVVGWNLWNLLYFKATIIENMEEQIKQYIFKLTKNSGKIILTNNNS
ncbi:MAG: hypothetical protein PWQ34_684 [Caldanaerobacter sp.]|jgi:hypothetical protein|nr:hypothetical protein [Caldanaerobacter sp.]